VFSGSGAVSDVIADSLASTSTGVVTLDATASGLVDLDLSAENDTGFILKLGTGGSSITLGDAAIQDVIELTAGSTGSDAIVLGSGNTVGNLATVDTVENLGLGDAIDMAGNGANVYEVTISSTSAFSAKVNTQLASLAGYSGLRAANDVILVSVDGDSSLYVVVDVGGNGVDSTDGLVKLTGTIGSNLDSSTFV